MSYLSYRGCSPRCVARHCARQSADEIYGSRTEARRDERARSYPSRQIRHMSWASTPSQSPSSKAEIERTPVSTGTSPGSSCSYSNLVAGCCSCASVLLLRSWVAHLILRFLVVAAEHQLCNATTTAHAVANANCCKSSVISESNCPEDKLQGFSGSEG